MTKVLNRCRDRVNASEMQTVCISNTGLEEIEKAGKVRLSDAQRAEIEEALNSYIIRNRWDRISRPAKSKELHSRSLRRHLKGLLSELDNLEKKFREAGEFDRAIALDDQRLFWRAGVQPLEFLDQLSSLHKHAEQDGSGKHRGGRPEDFFLPQFFCEFEDIFLRAGGRWVGVTKTLEDTRKSPFADFVNAILRFAPPGLGPSSNPAVAAAWERQLRSRRAPRANLK